MNRDRLPALPSRVANYFTRESSPARLVAPPLYGVADEPRAQLSPDERRFVVVASDPDGSLLAAFNGLAMPTTVLVDADGNVKYSRSVVLDEEALNGLIEEHLL